MRVLRSVLGACVCVVACVVVLTTVTSTSPTAPVIHSIVTHNLKEELEGKMTCDEEHLERLGFVSQPQVFPHHSWDNLTTPVLASAVWSGQVWQVEGLVGLAQQLLPNLTLVVYSLDLSLTEMQQLEDVCNTTCLVFTFDFSSYPSHVKDFRLKAYRPIIIQELLVRTGAVFWLDAGIRLAEEGVATERAQGWVATALRSGGVLTWPLYNQASLPSAALTHPNMFAFFHTRKTNYDFLEMGDAGTIVVYNTPDVHKYLMKPWVSCALTHNCISPIGAQETGCRYDKKPIFRYSGCHHYDASAFNVALGVMFAYESQPPYLAAQSPFVRIVRKPQTEEERLSEEEGRNTSYKDSSTRKYTSRRGNKMVNLESPHKLQQQNSSVTISVVGTQEVFLDERRRPGEGMGRPGGEYTRREGVN